MKFRMILAASMLVLAGCQTGPRPGEVEVKGGKVEASRTDLGGWSFRTLEKPAPEPAPEPKRPWILILHPLPQEPEEFEEAVTPAPVSEPEKP